MFIRFFHGVCHEKQSCMQISVGRDCRTGYKYIRYLFININQLDAVNFIISLFQASTCFEHMCSKHVEA